jgi:prevent-host-death family protein
MVMKMASVSEVKARLSEYLARAQRGEEVLVTDRGRPVAKLVPIGVAERGLAELEREGLIRAGAMRLPEGFLNRPRPRPAGPGLVDALLDERREGR